MEAKASFEKEQASKLELTEIILSSPEPVSWRRERVKSTSVIPSSLPHTENVIFLDIQIS